MASRIPIANIYYLLSYAWDHWAQGNMVEVDKLDGPDTTNLLAHMLEAATRHAIRRGLHRDYHTYEQEIPGIRGRLLIAQSKQRLLFEHGRAACAVSELDYASIPNRIIKTTLGLLHAAEPVEIQIRDRLGITLRQLRIVPEIQLSAGLFRRVRMNRSNAHYTFLLSLCELAFDCLQANPGGSELRFRDFSQDDAWMHQLFEDFVRNFYRAEADTTGWACLGRTVIHWEAVPEDQESADLLPEMETDVSLERGSQLLVIDCKFYGHALSGQFGERLNSTNMYQIWSYVSQLRRRSAKTVEGILLYPTVGRGFATDYQIDGNRVRAVTVDLNQDWHDIRDQLVKLIA